MMDKLKSTNILQSTTLTKQNQNKIKRSTQQGKENKYRKDYYTNISEQELQSICHRAVLLHTTGKYYPPEEIYTCQNKNSAKSMARKKKEPNLNQKKKSTKFGQGRVGVSCESYGIKNCACCKPNNAPPNYVFNVPTASALAIDIASNSNSGVDRVDDDDEEDIVYVGTETRSPVVIDITDESFALDTNVGTEINLTTNTSVDTEPIVKSEVMHILDSTAEEHDIEKFEDEFIKMIDEEMKKTNSQPIASTSTVTSEPSGVSNILNLADTNSNSIDLESQKIPVINLTNLSRKVQTPGSTVVNLVDDNSRKNSSAVEIVDISSDLNESVSSSPSVNVQKPQLICPVCLEHLSKKEVMSTICGHIFCAPCIKHCVKLNKQCPNCRKKLTLKSIHPLYLGTL